MSYKYQTLSEKSSQEKSKTDLTFCIFAVNKYTGGLLQLLMFGMSWAFWALGIQIYSILCVLGSN